MSKQGNIQTTFTKGGLRRYYIEIQHDRLNKYQVIRGDNSYIVEQKARTKTAQWDEMWGRKQITEKNRLEREQRTLDKKQKNNLAAQKTQESQDTLSSLENILAHTLNIDDTVDWDTLKNHDDYPTVKPIEPKEPEEPKFEDAPLSTNEKYLPKFGFLDKLFKSLKIKKQNTAKALYKKDKRAWEKAIKKAQSEYDGIIAKHEKALSEYKKSISAWKKARDKFIQKREKNNDSIDKKRGSYLQSDAEAILDYCDIVLSNSEYPDFFPQTYDLDFNPEGNFLIVDYQLPDTETIPTVKEVKYIQTRDEFKEINISKTQFNKLYDNLSYQIALRTIHELFEADNINALTFIVFNGYVKSIDPATGQEKVACILSLQANQEEFDAINLANIEPKACFKNLKGIGSSRLHSLTPIAPILRIDREDKRFIDSYAVADELGEKDNLAAMAWEDFEHLVRELFEKEFASTGGEVKITRASRDGGIDAVAFDPDPIRGGKLVIQAKRYTNTVGVSAVRDLYGSLINEGASKGILVTTADYGPDAYEFAKDKPLVLLNGNNLLHLLEKHGHKAKIDIKEAKRLLAEE